MPPQAVSQMNVRMDTQLKNAGDKVLAEGDTTPTQLVRALWEKISRGTSDLRQVEEVLGISAPPAPSPCANASKLETIQRGRGLFVQGLATWGIPESAVVAHEENADTGRYTEELVDRMRGRDLW